MATSTRFLGVMTTKEFIENALANHEDEVIEMCKELVSYHDRFEGKNNSFAPSILMGTKSVLRYRRLVVAPIQSGGRGKFTFSLSADNMEKILQGHTGVMVILCNKHREVTY